MYFFIAIVLVFVFVLITYSQVRTHTHAYPKWHVEVVSGMSNRIRAIVGLIYCSRILNRRLVVHWNKSDACNGLYSELFKSSNLFDLVEVENSSNPNPKSKNERYEYENHKSISRGWSQNRFRGVKCDPMRGNPTVTVDTAPN